MKTNKTTHTPGPWGVIENSNMADMIVSICKDKIDAPRTVLDPDNGIVGKDSAQAVANARLIAAAPELLDACKNAANVLAALAVGTLTKVERDSPAILQLRAAISKAEGK